MVDSNAKIITVDEAVGVVRAATDDGDQVVHCHGCFDILHPGHIRHLRHARTLGERLLVSVTRDIGVDKGEGRPLIPQELRAENIAALDVVDWVVINPEVTAAGLLERVKPSIYVKGREYEHNDDPRFAEERAVVERHGGRVVFSSGDVVFSSTALIASLEDSADPFHRRLRQLVTQHGLDPARLEGFIDGFRGRRVLVLGETVVDTYVLCDRADVAAEAPVMTLRPIERRSFDGGAAIVARHLAAMGARPILVTGLPASIETEHLLQRLGADGVAVRHVKTNERPHEKERYLVGASKVMKVDHGRPLSLDQATQARLVGLAAETARSCDAAILVDYGLGLLAGETLPQACLALRGHVDLLAGDVSGRRANLLGFRGLDVIAPGEQEVRDAMHDYEGGLSDLVHRLLGRIDSRRAIVTLGADGLIAFEEASEHARDASRGHRLVGEHVPSFAPIAVDLLGCGDALLAATTLALAAGATFVQAAAIGSLAASCQAQRLGNAVVDASDLRRAAQRPAGARLVYTPEPEHHAAVVAV